MKNECKKVNRTEWQNISIYDLLDKIELLSTWSMKASTKYQVTENFDNQETSTYEVKNLIPCIDSEVYESEIVEIVRFEYTKDDGCVEDILVYDNSKVLGAFLLKLVENVTYKVDMIKSEYTAKISFSDGEIIIVAYF